MNLEIVARIADAVGVPVQLGGGLRDRGAVEAAFEAGAARAVLGTERPARPRPARRARRAYGDRIVASVDARGGKVAVEGWEQATATPVDDAIADLGAARRQPLRLHAGRGRRDARGPRARRPRARSSPPARRPASS